MKRACHGVSSRKWHGDDARSRESCHASELRTLQFLHIEQDDDDAIVEQQLQAKSRATGEDAC
jgi:hypothetical protein